MGKEIATITIEVDEESEYYKNLGNGEFEELLNFHGITLIEIKESTVEEDDFKEDEE